MSDTTTSGFSDRGQEPFGDIPTDPDAFLEWASRQPREAGRFELSNGQVVRTMINVTRRHALICSNIAFELMQQLDRSLYDVATADFAVRTANGIRGPDIVVDVARPDGSELSTSEPIFIAEVLSPSSAAIDLTTKQREYTALASLETYLVLSQDAPLAWVWARRPDRSWPLDAEMLEGRDGAISLGGLGITLSMDAIFRGIPDAPTIP
ncbi:MAG: Uma2 family endonuclease [Hyphomicrobium sp.]|uniref:Uma2 family endonuclease n=1 Tax=Hyphomicrobium sp. TaxID=82 RepID=UPI003D0C2505